MLCERLSCSSHQLQSALTTFLGCFQQVLSQLKQTEEEQLVDATNHHLWTISSGDPWSVLKNKSCMCGAVGNIDGKLNFSCLGENLQNGEPSAERGSFGLFDRKSVLTWDSMNDFTSALRTAVLTANAILGVHSYIENAN